METPQNPREQRGILLAATKNIRKVGEKWYVPSATNVSTHYSVNVQTQDCNCPDHGTHGVKCKHLYAVEYTIRRETDPNGITTTTETIRAETRRVTYPQDWSAYNAAQTTEKATFMRWLADLCQNVPQPLQATGRPRLPMSDMVFATTYKVYSGFSTRRFTTDMREANQDGLMTSAPHFNRISSYLSDPTLTPILKGLITASSLPMKSLESDFATDSSGFSTSRFIRWYNKKYGKETDNREWVKVHLTCGVQTHIVTAVEISGWSANDTTFFVPLIEATAQNFQIREFSADKAYSGRANLHAVAAVGGQAYIPFRSNTTGLPSSKAPKFDGLWNKAFHFYNLHREEFLEHYHKRSNVETVFSMVKAKFGDSVRSKTDTGMVNEVLAKVLCHNICVVNQAAHEFGVDVSFRAGSTDARKLTVAGGF